MKTITIELTNDEALVLFEWLAGRAKQTELEGEAERRVLWDLEASLERSLDEIFAPNYGELLEQARARIASNDAS